MSDTRYYYINNDAKIVMYFAERQEPAPEGFEFCGLSQMPIMGAAGYYAKNQEGFKIINGDEEKTEDAADDVSED